MELKVYWNSLTIVGKIFLFPFIVMGELVLCGVGAVVKVLFKS